MVSIKLILPLSLRRDRAILALLSTMVSIKLILPLSLRPRGRFVKEQQLVVPPNLRTPISGAANLPVPLVESPYFHYK